MVLEMKRALEDLKTGDSQGYRKIFDATYQEVYCRSLLIIQKEDQAMEFMKGFLAELLKSLDEADSAADQERWLWRKFYQYLRRQYHKLLAAQKDEGSKSARTLAEIPAGLPLLHRIMLVMSCKDDFTAAEISGIFGLEEAQVKGELDKLEKFLPALTKGQPESVSSYLANWKVLLMGASKQLLTTSSNDWVDRLFAEAAASAGIVVEPQVKKEAFEYFVADVDLSEEEPVQQPVQPKKKKAAPIPIVEEEDEEDDDEDEYDDEYDDDEDDEYDDDDDDRYDWDLEDDGRKMVILGAILALVIVVIIGFGAMKLLNKDKDESGEQVTTEQEDEDGEASLIIKGDGPGENEEEEEPAEEPAEEEPPEEPEEEPAEEEPQTYVMEVTGSTVNIRSESNTNSDVVTKVTAGEKVEVLSDPAAEWVQVRCTEQNGEEGYMKTEYLTDVE